MVSLQPAIPGPSLRGKSLLLLSKILFNVVTRVWYKMPHAFSEIAFIRVVVPFG